VRAMLQVCSLSISGIACSNPADGMEVRPIAFVVCCEGSGFCDELITRSEGGVMPRVCVCVI
jgi:hypothetical protein